MKPRIKIFMIILSAIVFVSLQTCGNLLQEPGIEPTLQQRLRGVWIVGGLSSNVIATGTSSAIAGVDLYDPVKDAWYQNTTALPVPVSFAGVASCDGKIYVIGGFDTTGNPRSNVQIYDVASGSWSAGADIYIAPTTYTKANMDAVTVGSKIYFVGGTITAYSAWVAPVTNQVFEYDTVTNVWALLVPTLATNRANMNTVALNDMVYFMGGRSAALTISNLNEGYIASLLLATTAVETAIATTRAGFASVLYAPATGPARMITIGGAITLTSVTGAYVFYAATPATVAGTMSPMTSYLTNPFTGTGVVWTNTTNAYPNSVGFASAALYGSRVYCFGGVNTFTAGSNPSIYTNVYSLDLTNLPAGNWEAKAGMPVGRFGHAAVTIKQ